MHFKCENAREFPIEMHVNFEYTRVHFRVLKCTCIMAAQAAALAPDRVIPTFLFAVYLLLAGGLAFTQLLAQHRNLFALLRGRRAEVLFQPFGRVVLANGIVRAV